MWPETNIVGVGSGNKTRRLDPGDPGTADSSSTSAAVITCFLKSLCLACEQCVTQRVIHCSQGHAGEGDAHPPNE